MTRVLVYDPCETWAMQIRDSLESHSLWVMPCSSLESARELLDRQLFHIVIWPVENSVDVSVLSDLKHRRPDTMFLVSSNSLDPSLVVDCMRHGASNFWRRIPNSDIELGAVDLPQVSLEILNKIISELIGELTFESNAIDFPVPEFIGRHPKMLEVFQLILSVKDGDSTVLITGESGTGKELVALAIHNLGNRRKSPWVAVNCGAIPISLLESELFGHVKGAFTGAIQNRKGRFQMAREGTIFLDEITDLPLDLQSKILRAIQNRTYESVGSPHSLRLEARIIAATNQSLEAAVSDKKFREDLYYRLNVIPINIPPLRSRKSDIPLLVKHFLDRFTQANNKKISGISEEAMRCLMEYHWPGNIRELENLMERVVVLKRSPGIIDLRDFPTDYFRNIRLDRFVANVALPDEGLDFNSAVNDFENELILQALYRTSGNRNKAASLLNLNRTTLVEKLKRKGLKIAS